MLKYMYSCFLLLQFPCLVFAENFAYTHVNQIRRLTKSEALQHATLTLDGVITFSRSGTDYQFILDDGEEGIRCILPKTPENRVLLDTILPQSNHLCVGSHLRVRGVTDFGEYAPVVQVIDIHVLGKRDLPLPKKPTLEELFSGTMESQRIQVEGVVRFAKKEKEGVLLHIGTLFDRYQVVIDPAPDVAVDSLPDAKIRVVGCLVPICNAGHDLIGISIEASDRNEFTIITPAPNDPFSIPQSSFTQIRSFSPGGANLHRRKIKGVVTFSRTFDNYFFMRESGHNLRVSVVHKNTFVPGDLVEATGFTNFRSTTPRIEEALARKVGTSSEPIPAPLPVTIEALRQEYDWTTDHPIKDWFGEMVTLDAFVLDVNKRETFLQLVVGEKGRSVHVAIPLSPSDPIPLNLQIGAYVRLSGIAVVNYQAWNMGDNLGKIADVTINLQNKESLTVLNPPSWWTTKRITTVIGIGVLLIALSLLWIVSLRRTVRKQTHLLEESLRSHHNAELEFAAAKRERLRLSHDLHDGFQQLLAGSMYRIKAALNYLPDDAIAAREQLDDAQQSLMHTQKGLRKALWGLTEESEGPADFIGLLKNAVQHMEHWKGIVHITHEGKEPPMSRHVMGSLLMVVQEAIGNAVAHGHATVITLHVQFDDSGVLLMIDDNGCGFNPADPALRKTGHWGIRSMEERLDSFSGRFTLTSSSGKGTHITAYIDARKLQ